MTKKNFVSRGKHNVTCLYNNELKWQQKATGVERDRSGWCTVLEPKKISLTFVI